MQQVGPRVPAIAAHRGWHAGGAAENSIAALERAAAGGADAVEMDIRRLGDGTLIVHHDASIDGQPLEQLDRSILRRHPQIATLDDWSRRAGELGIRVIAEAKAAGSERATLDALLGTTDAPRLDRARLDLLSFEPDAARGFSQLAPDRPVGLNSNPEPALDGAALVRNARAAGASYLGLNVAQATEPVLEAARRAGMGVSVWTVNDPADLSRLIGDRRVSTVITDVPQLALGIRDAIHGPGAASAGLRLLRAAVAAR